MVEQTRKLVEQEHTETQALAFFTPPGIAYRQEFSNGVRQALSVRDQQFGDYRESGKLT